MTQTGRPPTPPTGKEERELRRAEALRANLKRRKAQARARETGRDTAPGAPAPSGRDKEP